MHESDPINSPSPASIDEAIEADDALMRETMEAEAELLEEYERLKQERDKAWVQYREVSQPFGSDMDDWGLYDAEDRKHMYSLYEIAEEKVKQFEQDNPEIVELLKEEQRSNTPYQHTYVRSKDWKYDPKLANL